MKIGDLVVDSGGLQGRVVANIDSGEFTDAFPEADWAYLLRGVVVDTEEAGTVHYPDPAELALATA